ncbi:MAG: rRNA maturation RNase YbeY [Bacteroidota bacterium]
MISFNSESNFNVENFQDVNEWLSKVISSENKSEGEINYIFCDDNYLLKLNQKYLNHDTFTDIITFDYTLGNELHGDIYISVERVKENADTYKVDFENELRRVMVHGVLHLCGYKDKTESDARMMRGKEDFYLEPGI